MSEDEDKISVSVPWAPLGPKQTSVGRGLDPSSSAVHRSDSEGRGRSAPSFSTPISQKKEEGEGGEGWGDGEGW